MADQTSPSTSIPIFRRAGLAIILLIFVTLAVGYSLIVPLTQGEDELAHYRYIQFIAQNGRLPATPAERHQAWYRADWPPLYHLLVGAVVSPLDTTRPVLKDVGQLPQRRLVGEIFYPRLIIYTEDANWPWQDGILAWHLGRFISIALAATALIFTYLTALELTRPAAPSQFPPLRLPGAISPPAFAAAVTALLAFTPRFLFTSAMLSDDSLFILLSAVFIWLLLRALRGSDSRWIYVLLGLLLGLSIATKYSTGLLPLTLLPLLWWRKKEAGWGWGAVAGRLVVAGLGLVIGCGWWFGWVIWHFNTISADGLFFGLLSPVLASGPDVSMRRAFAFFTGESFTGALRPAAVAEGTFNDWTVYLFQTFWGVPVLEHDPFLPWAYLLVLLLVILSLWGLAGYWQAAPVSSRRSMGLLGLVVLLLLPFPILRFFLTHNILETGQGRHLLYPAAQAIPILLTLGWLEQLAKTNHQLKTQKLSFKIHPAVIFLLPALLLIWSIAQLGYMRRVYPAPLPVKTTTFTEAEIPQPLKHTFTDSLQFLGYDFQPDPAQALINLTLFWQALAPPDQNYRTRIQLVDTAGTSHFTWLSHPVNGLYPTRAWDPGDVVRDTLPLPLAAVPAGVYQIQLDVLPEDSLTPVNPTPFQLIQFTLGAVQPIPHPAAFDESTTYRLWVDAATPVRARQTIALSWQTTAALPPQWALLGPDDQPRPPVVTGDATAIFIVEPDWPGGPYRLTTTTGGPVTEPLFSIAAANRQFAPPTELTAQPDWTPVAANFANQIELTGYRLPERRIAPGAGVPLSLLWRGLSPAPPDAVTFAVLLDARQQPFGSVDRYPAGYNSPILWANGEYVTDDFTLPVAAAAPSGIYTIHLGQYVLADGQPQSLPLYQQGQPTETTAVVIGPLKIGGPPPETVIANPQPQHPINQTLGSQITLLGYDINKTENLNSPNSQNSPNPLTLKLYWQADAAPAADYTTFVHLRDAANQTVAQQDAPPAAGRYPTGLWDAGEIIADEISLPLDQLPPGEYTPVVGLYQPATGARLSTPGNPANEIALEPIRIPE